MTGIARSAGGSTIFATVLATAAPSSSGPSRLNTDAIRTAGSGRAARVATRVAIAFAASWNPFVSANASAIPMDSTNARLTTTASSAG
jgi:hypothetical protein